MHRDGEICNLKGVITVRKPITLQKYDSTRKYIEETAEIQKYVQYFF